MDESNKFNIFYEALKSFCIGLSFSSVEDFKGIRKEEIKSFEDKKNISFDRCMLMYLKNFGRQIFVKNISLGSIRYTLEEIEGAMKIAEKKGVINVIAGENKVEGWEERDLDSPMDDIILLNYDKIGSVFSFIPVGEENPIVYYYWEGGGLSSDNYSIIDTIRNTLFWGISNAFYGYTAQKTSNDRLAKLLEAKVLKIIWLKFYKKLYSIDKRIRGKLVSWRQEFCQSIREWESKESRLMGIDEFEVGFIKFLIEKKGISPMPDVFDPYAPLITFQDYLGDAWEGKIS